MRQSMEHTHRRRARSAFGALKAIGLVLGLSAALGLVACEKSGKELMIEADQALQAGDVERAERALGEAAAKEPDSFQVPILRSKIYSAKKEYERAEQELDALWKAQRLDEEKLTTEQKRIRQLVGEQYYPDLYREWSESIDPKASPQKYEEVLSKGVERYPKGPLLKTMLAGFYQDRGEELIAQGKKEEGAELFDKIVALRIVLPGSDQDFAARAETLRQEARAERITSRFEGQLLPELKRAERYDEANKLVLFKAEGEVDRRAKPEEALQAAEAQIAQQINEATRLIGELPEGAPYGAPTKTEFYKVVESDFKRGAYAVTASFPEQQLKEYARYVLDRQTKQGEAKRAEPGEAPPAAAPGEAPRQGADQGVVEADQGVAAP